METTALEKAAMEGDAAAQVALARALLPEGQLDEAEGWLRRAAATGHVEAMAELGQFLYLGRPPIPDAVVQEAVQLIIQAANQRHAPSAHLAALIAANDPTVPNNWGYALEYLTRAAIAGHNLAQFELAFLSGDPTAPMRLGSGAGFTPDDWQRLRDMVNIPALTQVPKARPLCTSPYIIAAENFLPPHLCDWIMRRAKPLLRRGRGYNPSGDGPIQRTNSEIEYPFPALDMVTMIVRQRIANLTGLSQAGMEPPSVFHYTPGQEFTAHYDWLDPEALKDEIARTGQCVATVLIYLSEDFDGGETHFLNIDYRFKGRKGEALIFRNVDETGAVDRNTYHCGRPPTRGEKWLFSQFVRNTRQANKTPGG